MAIIFNIFCLKQRDVCNASSKDFNESSCGGTVFKGGWLQFSTELTSWRDVLNQELLSMCARITVDRMQIGTIPLKNVRMSHCLASYSFDILFLEL